MEKRLASIYVALLHTERVYSGWEVIKVSQSHWGIFSSPCRELGYITDVVSFPGRSLLSFLSAQHKNGVLVW